MESMPLYNNSRTIY